MSVNADYNFPTVRQDWAARTPSPTSPFTMSFPDATNDEDLVNFNFFREFPGGDSVHFDDIDHLDPLPMYRDLSPDKNGAAAPFNMADNQLIEEKEQQPASLSPQHVNHGNPGSDAASNDPASAMRTQDVRHTQGVHTDDGVSNSPQTKSETCQSSVDGTANPPHGFLDALEASASPVNPELAINRSSITASDQPQLNQRRTTEQMAQNSITAESQNSCTNRTQPNSTFYDHYTGIMTGDPFDMDDWDLGNELVHTDNHTLAAVTYMDGQQEQHSDPAAQHVRSRQTTDEPLLSTSHSQALIASDDEQAHSLASTDFSSSMSPPPNYGPRRHSSPALGAQNSQQSSSSPMLQRQQQQIPRRHSNLRHVSVPGQAETLYQASPNARDLGDNGDLFSRSMPSVGRQQQYPMAMSRAQPLHPQSHGGNPMLHRFMSEDGQEQVIDFRRHSPASDVRASQYLSNSPSSDRGNHNIMTPNLTQSPRQPNLLLSQPLAYKHLAPMSLDYNPASQRGVNYSMKKENSSPESANAALSKVKRESRHAGGRRASQDFSSPASSADPDDINLIEAMYTAMMDMSVAEDNPGMKKTWTGLMKEQRKVWKVCETLLETCYKLAGNGGALQSAVKPQNDYESINHRVHELCKALKTQKTMCKHLMEAPYLYQVVDDPILAASRVINNRKVNSGKKKAIEAGREALKATQAGSPFGDEGPEDDDDASGEDDEDYNQTEFLQPSMSPSVRRARTTTKRGRQSTGLKASSEGSADATYDEPTTKKAKRPSMPNSRYNINEHGEMIDTGVSSRSRRRSTPQPHVRDRSSSARPQVAHLRGNSNVIDNRPNAGQTIRNGSTLYHTSSGLQGSGGLDPFTGGFQGANFAGGYSGRR